MFKVAVAIALIVVVLCAGAYLAARLGDIVLGFGQAQAQIETARAAQVASAGLSGVALLNAFILLLVFVLLVVVAGIVLYLLIERTRLQNHAELVRPRWVSGPNAHWQRLNAPMQRELPIYPNQLPERQQVLVVSDEEENDLSLQGWGF